jgi:formamidopyrimidine-DNA glycosylase
MPEICEYRTDADILDFYLSNRDLLSVEFITNLFQSKCDGIEELKKLLPIKVNKVMSKAKKLFIFLKKDQLEWWIILYYGMSGLISTIKEKHSHIKFTLSHSWIGMNQFYYQNIRRIGWVKAGDINFFQSHLNDMAPQIGLGYDLDGFKSISEIEFSENIKNAKHKSLVAALMDQRTICSGIGNWILSESLYEAKLDPEIKCNQLSKENIHNLYFSINKVIQTGYDHGGVSMSDYIQATGEEGNHEQYLKVYGRKGQKDCDGRNILNCKGKHGRTIWYVIF